LPWKQGSGRKEVNVVFCKTLSTAWQQKVPIKPSNNNTAKHTHANWKHWKDPAKTYVIFVSEIELRADNANGEVVMQPALADSCIQQRSLIAGVCANQQDNFGFFNAADLGVQ